MGNIQGRRACYSCKLTSGAIIRKLLSDRRRLGTPAWNAWQGWLAKNHKQFRQQFYQELEDRRQKVHNALKALPRQLPNARKEAHYCFSFYFPCDLARLSVTGLEHTGLQLTLDNGKQNLLCLSGIPHKSGACKPVFEARYTDWARGLPNIYHSFRLEILPDPRDLWLDLPSDKHIEYWRKDQDWQMLEYGDSRLFAASIRGRSHAHTGKPRDDAFGLACQKGWLMLAVADGAGSAEYSRKGAEIACDVALDSCKNMLDRSRDLEDIFTHPLPENWQVMAKKHAYTLLAGAAFEAHKAIRREAENRARGVNSYASTLMLAVVRKFPPGWVVLSFQVGDGAMAMFCNGQAELLAQPDEGEYGGQTRFITMAEIFEPYELMRRVRVDVAPHFEEILMMTDGISDCRFPSQEAMRNQDLWHELRMEIDKKLDNAAWEAALVEWLNFWSKGSHDDRTIAIMQAG